LQLAFTRLWGLLAVLLLAFAGGCSGQATVELKGRVVRDGQPLKLGPQGVLEVILIPEQHDEQGEFSTIAPAVNYQDGSFENFEKIPAGRYRFAIQQLDPYPFNDKLKGAFSKEKSQIVRDVTGEHLEIDLARPEG
jgi:hypothetical protein